jgi:hypothetical protein
VSELSIKSSKFSQVHTFNDILVNNSFTSLNLFASLASAVKPWRAMKEIVQRIATMVMTTMISTRVKACFQFIAFSLFCIFLKLKNKAIL